jgi:hypothetical protein
LPPDWEARASRERDAATKAQLDALARRYFDPKNAIVVVVGPRSRVQPLIDASGMPPAELRDSEGEPVKP